MKKALTIPMPQINDGKPTIDRTTLVVEMDFDRAIAGEAFRESFRQPARSDRSTLQVHWPSLNVVPRSMRSSRLIVE